MSRKGENIYKRKDGRWEGRYIRDRRSDGSIHYGYVYAYSYNEVKQKLIPLKKKEFYVNNSRAIDNPYVLHWVQEWLDKENKRLKLSTYSTYKYKLQHYVLPILGSKRLSELTTQSLQELIDNYQIEHHLSASTIRNIFQILQKVLNEAIKKGYIGEDICTNVVLPKQTKRRVYALSQNEQRKLEGACKKSSNGLPTLLALYSGLRIGEIAALSWEDIDFENHLLYVNHTYQRIVTASKEQKTILYLGSTKTDTSRRVVPLSKTIISLLRDRKLNHTGKYLFMANGQPMEPRLLNYHFKKIVSQSKIRDIHFHQLRHTFATRCMEASGDIASVSALLGHSSTKTTLDVYVDSVIEQRKKIISKVEEMVNF